MPATDPLQEFGYGSGALYCLLDREVVTCDDDTLRDKRKDAIGVLTDKERLELPMRGYVTAKSIERPIHWLDPFMIATV
jgi:hypothetical protein